MSKNLIVGDAAPLFTLTDHLGKEHSLEQALKKGPVVLQFYPYDQSPNCKRRLCSINQLRDEYHAERISVFGINNARQESHANFADKAELTMPLLSDTEFRVARAYDALFEIGPIHVIRTTTVAIGTDGRVIFHQHGELPQLESFIRFIKQAGGTAPA